MYSSNFLLFFFLARIEHLPGAWRGPGSGEIMMGKQITDRA